MVKFTEIEETIFFVVVLVYQRSNLLTLHDQETEITKP